MNHIHYRISLDMFDVAVQTTLKAKKGDTACTIHITLTENGRVYNIADGCNAFFSAKKPDGNFLYHSAECSIEDNEIVYHFTEQTVPCEGIVECEVILLKGDQRLTSPRFNLLVDGTVYNGEEIESKTDVDAFGYLVKKAQEAANKADSYQQQAWSYLETIEANVLESRQNLEDADRAARKAEECQNEADSSAETAGEYASAAQAFAENAQGFATQASGYVASAESAAKNAEANELNSRQNMDEAKQAAIDAGGYRDETEETSRNIQAAMDEANDILNSAKNDFSNALNKTVSDYVVRIEDASPLEHEMSVSLTLLDSTLELSDFVLYRHRKNLLRFPYSSLPAGTGSTEINGVTFTVFNGGKVRVNGTATADAQFFLRSSSSSEKQVLQPGTYYVSGCPANGSTSTYFMGGFSMNDVGNGFKRVLDKQTSDWFYIKIIAGTTVKNLVFAPQIELGDVKTTFYPYVEPTVYAPVSDSQGGGIVNGVTPITPTTTLMLNSDQAKLTVKYNRDINKAFAELITAVQTLGGII
ncbi:MAG: DUF2479 domain-containing protein [Ruminococcaceae bacterium]|nr:DUF2479 domain-containing protein [Oscillospiraceae bacterium]